MNNAFPLLIRFLSDRQSEVPLSVSPFISDLLRMASIGVTLICVLTIL